jgi:stage V sporulation protein B
MQMFIFSEAFSEVLYGGEVKPEFIRLLTVIVPMAFMDSVSCGILNGMGRQRTMLTYSLSDSIGRLAVIYLFVPVFGMRGFLFIIILSNIFTATLTSRKVCGITGARFGWADRVLKHVFCAFLAGSMAFFLKLHSVKTTEEIVFGVLISAGIYVLAEMLVSPAVRNDFSWLRNRMFFNT